MNVIEGKGVGFKKTSHYRLLEFDSMDEFLTESKKKHDPKGASSKPKDKYGGGFYNSASYDEAWQLAYDGWTTVRPKVDQTLEGVREKLKDLINPVETRVHDIIGYEPDIDRFVSGEIECMWDSMMIEAPHAGRVFTVLLDNSLSSSQDKDEILKRGAAVIALIEAFQMFGFELEIWVEHTVSDWGSDFHTTLVRVNRAGDRPDINAIMFPLGNPDWLRRLIFGLEEGEPDEVKSKFGFNGSGYGCPRQGAHMTDRVGASIAISLEAPDGRMVSDPVKWILDQLRAQGVVSDGD